MKKIILLFFLIIIPITGAFSQFDKFSFQVNLGITSPTGELKGESPFSYIPSWKQYFYNPYKNAIDSSILYNILMTDSSFMKDNYGATTGFSISGAGKINIDKYNTFRGIFTLSFSSFNSFESDKSGQTPFLLMTPQFQGYTYVPVQFSSSFTAFGLGLGLELAPTSFTNAFTPYFGGTFNFNFLGATLTRAYGRDSIKAEIGSEFRIGAALHGGLELKVSKGMDIVAGVKYDFGNLLLKNTRSSFSDAVTYGKTNISLNDAEGFYYSNLANAEGEGYKQYYTKDKKINWWTFFIGLNFYPNLMDNTPKKTRLLN
jgi:hypothetical protein